jgi:hypothetical protein
VVGGIWRFIFLQTRKTIGDRQFVSFVQFYLHKCGEITFGRMHIGNWDGPTMIVNEENRVLPLAVVPISKNVKNFKSIVIRFVFAIKFCAGTKLNYSAL